jgi:signal transduction histidine kinase
MTTISQTYAQYIEEIFERWKARVRCDRKIESSEHLSDLALGNSVPKLLEAITTALSLSEEDDFDKIVSASIEHAIHRFEQGFNIKEIAREYRLLRVTIFDVLESDLLKLSTFQQNRAFRLIDAIIDEASAQCFRQFVLEREEELECLQEQQVLQYQELNRLLSLNKENLSYLAHEIKNPLNSIVGHSQLLLAHYKKQELEDKMSLNSLERVMRSSNQILHLLNDALAMSKTELVEKQLKLVSIDPRMAIRDFVTLIQPLAETKSLQLNLNLEQAPDSVLTDIICLEQIVTNLLSNAIRYTDRGSITINCQLLSNSNSQKWSISISDTGIGIPPEEHQLIFEPFSRASTNTAQYREGSTGLGLAIVYRLVKCLQGEIEVVSQVEEGSEFTVIFPLVFDNNS